MRAMTALLLLLTAACATSTSTAVPPPHQVDRIDIGEAGTVQLTHDARPNTFSLPFLPASTWGALPAAYETLGITVNHLDEKQLLMGGTGMRLRRRLGGEPLGKYLDCGGGLGGANADSYDVNLTLLARVAPEGKAGSTLAVELQALARPMNVSGDWLRCTSRGVLEKRLADLVRAELAY